MEHESRNIYRNARRTAGLTQERWAEMLGCSVESVRNYEAGRQLPSDEIVRAMTEVSSVTPLCYWHIVNKGGLAAELLPDVELLPMPQAVVQVLCAMNDFAEDHPTLLRIAADGKISQQEEAAWAQIAQKLDRVVRAAVQLKLSEGGSGNGP